MNSTDECGLLLVDLQGKLARIVTNSDEMISNTAELLQSCIELSIPIVGLEQNPAGLGPTVPELKALVPELTFLEKHHFNGIAEEPICEKIKALNKSHWIVAGIEAHICVYQTVTGLLDEGYQVTIVSDCISSRKASNVELAITNMREMGANIASVEMLMYELMKSSQHSKFKSVLNIIK
jgi:nicotinamidase-related amidase